MANDRFISLLTKELCEQLTEAERGELQSFLQENPHFMFQRELLKNYWERDRVEHEANASMFRKVLDKIRVAENDPLAARPTSIPLHPDPDYASLFPDRKRSRTLWYSAAAALILVIGGYLLLHSNTHAAGSKPVATVDWRWESTRPTKKSVLTLSDGTQVTLNSATTIKYPDHFGDSTREIYLDGEAFFDVAKDVLHPFIIHANKMNIRVLGTSFNVKSYLNESLSEATLIKGSIEVTLNDRPSDRIILKPKEKLIVQNNLLLKKQVDLAASSSTSDNGAKDTRYSLTNLTYFHNDIRTVVETSWVENKLVFSDKDFSQLSGQLERWYGVHIEFGNERVKEYRFTGFFEKETLPQALDVLKMIEHFHYKISDSTVYIY